MLELLLQDKQEKNKKLEELWREVVGLGKQKAEEVHVTIMEDPTITLNDVYAKGVACNEDQLQLLIANALKSR